MFSQVAELQADLENQLNSSKQTEEVMRYMLQDRQDLDPNLADLIAGVTNGGKLIRIFYIKILTIYIYLHIIVCLQCNVTVDILML